jgi:acyl carrier protein
MREKLLVLLAAYTGAGISAETSLSELAMDSLETLDLVREIESVFHCSIPDADIEHIRTVGDFFRYLPA